MKRWGVVILIAALLSGCGSGQAEETKASVQEIVTSGGNSISAGNEAGKKAGNEAGKESDKDDGHEKTAGQTETVVIMKTAPAKMPEDMILYSSLPFQFGDGDWKLELCAAGEMDVNGELLMDDSSRFLIKAVSGEWEFRLFDEQVQLGVPSAVVMTDKEDKLHIILKDVRTAKYEITDYTYDEKTQTFSGIKSPAYSGINFIGEIGNNPGVSGSVSGAASGAFSAESATTVSTDREKEICGFIRKIDGDKVEVDSAEYITAEDADRMKELNLTENDLPDGYFIYEGDSETKTFTLTKDTVYHFIDWGRDFVDSEDFEDVKITTTSKALFVKYINTYEDARPGMPFFFRVNNGEVVSILEKPMA
ncbi:MAG: hypothetical protein KH366_04520 [Clostridiaceae bacterium]|nr:hypothetical protein [Clostridiaceae bacterium]